MFKLRTLAALVSAALAPITTLADQPNWDFVEISYVSSEGSGFDDVEPDGYEIAGSFAPTDWAFLDLRYLDEDGSTNINLIGGRARLELTRERFSAGGGVAFEIFEATDLYGRLAYEEWTLDATVKAGGESVSDDVNEEGYSTGIGFRSVLLQALEFRGEISYFDVDNILDKEYGYVLGAYYTFGGHVTLGGSFQEIDDYETYRATLRYQF